MANQGRGAVPEQAAQRLSWLAWACTAPWALAPGGSPGLEGPPLTSRQEATRTEQTEHWSPPGVPAERRAKCLLLAQQGVGAHLVPPHNALKLGLLSTRKRAPGGQNNQKLKLENKLLG